MATRQSTTICASGWQYLFVLLFIVGGAVLGEVNLLVVLAGLMLGPLLFNWRFVKATLRDVEFVRSLPQRIRTGDALSVAVTAHNRRSRLASWAIAIEDTVVREDDSARDGRMRVRVLVPRVAAGLSGTAKYRITLSRRGRYRFGPLRVSTRFPLGLVRARSVMGEPQSVLVCPRIGRLTQRWIQVINTKQVGNQAVGKQHGTQEGDFFGLREWRTGDSQRWIHWRTSAKLGELAVRQFEQQRNRNMVLVLDLWQPDLPTDDERMHTEVSISFLATAVSDICRRGGSRVVVSVAGQETRHWSGPASTILALEVLDHLAEIVPGDGLQIYEVLDEVQRLSRAGTRATVISTRGAPFLTAEENWESGARPADERRSFGNLTWIDCRSDALRQYFLLER